MIHHFSLAGLLSELVGEVSELNCARTQYHSDLERKIGKQIQARERLLSAGARVDPAYADLVASETKQFKEEFDGARGNEQRLRALRKALRRRGMPQLKNCRRLSSTAARSSSSKCLSGPASPSSP